MGVAVVTAFYEVLTTMAAGALTAALLFLAFPPKVVMPHVHPVWAGLGLLALCGVPLMPAVFQSHDGQNWQTAFSRSKHSNCLVCERRRC